ncbi:unnamed protein product [Ectocarpus sp. CCAP 1310/34]|nr:unnamed protein product [Ectocarpus sp. CCAP 1310/34]
MDSTPTPPRRHTGAARLGTTTQMRGTAAPQMGLGSSPSPGDAAGGGGGAPEPEGGSAATRVGSVPGARRSRSLTTKVPLVSVGRLRRRSYSGRRSRNTTLSQRVGRSWRENIGVG